MRRRETACCVFDGPHESLYTLHFFRLQLRESRMYWSMSRRAIAYYVEGIAFTAIEDERRNFFAK